MASDTRQRLVDAARDRFYNDGFRNVGLDQILEDVGISKTAYYKHFDSKESLMLEVLNQTDLWLQQTMRDMVRSKGGKSAMGQLRALFDVVDQIMNTGEFHGCIFVSAAMEFPLQHDPAHQAAARNKEAIETLIHDIAERAGAPDPEAMAKEIGLIIEGAFVTRSITGDSETIAIARNIAEGVFARHLPDTAVKEA